MYYDTGLILERSQSLDHLKKSKSSPEHGPLLNLEAHLNLNPDPEHQALEAVRKVWTRLEIMDMTRECFEVMF
jgi:hypothetical protein